MRWLLAFALLLSACSIHHRQSDERRPVTVPTGHLGGFTALGVGGAALAGAGYAPEKPRGALGGVGIAMMGGALLWAVLVTTAYHRPHKPKPWERSQSLP